MSYKGIQAKSLSSRKHVGAGITFVDRRGHRVTGEIVSVTPVVSAIGKRETNFAVDVVAETSTWENPQEDTYLFGANDPIQVDVPQTQEAAQ